VSTSTEDRADTPFQDELAALAERLLRRQRRELGIAPAALVDALRRRQGAADPTLEERAARLVAARQAMRELLDEHGRLAEEPAAAAWSLDEIMAVFEAQAIDLEAFDAALDQLESVDPHLSRIVELSFFGGMTPEAFAELLGTTPEAVREERRRARALIARALAPPD
jgi:DNA-directed RNA polymerase specialized sigma24 family protein